MPNKRERNPIWLRRAAASLMVIPLVFASACSGGDKEGSSSPEASPAASSESKKDITLSYWSAMGAASSRILKSYNDMLFYQELEKITGVKISFQHPAVGSETEQFNLLIASGKYPDMIEYNFLNYPGGPEKALSDNVIIELNDVIDKYAPNLKKYLDEHPEMKKEVTTDSGKMYVFPGIGIGNTGVTSGLMIRKDWLDELGLEAPQTIEDWTALLRAFKTQKQASVPLTMMLGNFNSQQFNGAFGIGTDFYLEGETVKYGPIQPGYKEYLALLNQWYEEGLLDPDFATQDNAAFDAKIVNSNAGAFFTSVGGGLGKYLPALQAKNAAYDLVGVQYPILNSGDEPRFLTTSYEYRGTGSVGITTANKQIEETAKWLDFYYTDEGHMLKSFGVEGITYTNENGYPRYTDLIMNNPDGLSVGDALSLYTRVASPAVGFVGDDRYSEQYMALDQQQAALETFRQFQSNAYKTRLPLISHTPEEANELSTIMAEVNTYREEMFLKFIMGAEPLSNFDTYVAQTKQMNIDKATAMKQSAVERYNNR